MLQCKSSPAACNLGGRSSGSIVVGLRWAEVHLPHLHQAQGDHQAGRLDLETPSVQGDPLSWDPSPWPASPD